MAALKAMDKVVVHPLVLLSVVDHFNRIGKVGSQSRVVGVLLGQWKTIDGQKLLDISNSFAVPFDEDAKDRSVWFLDHDYLESMATMFKKVNAKERIVGWYHTGPKLCSNDIDIHDLIKRYNSNAVLVIIDAKPKELGLPTEAYVSVEEVHDDGTPTTKTFKHVPSDIDAEEAEEVGVEHLLRDIHNVTVGTLSQRITNQLQGVKGLGEKLLEIKNYLDKVSCGALPLNHAIIYNLQDIFNLLPDVNLGEFSKAFYLKTNDQMLIVYLSCLIRSVIALHNLINNKVKTREAERGDTGKSKKAAIAAAAGGDEAGDKKDKEKSEKDSKSSAKSSSKSASKK